MFQKITGPLQAIFMKDFERLLKKYYEVQNQQAEAIGKVISIANRVTSSEAVNYTLEECVEISNILEKQGEEVTELYMWANKVIRVELTAEQAQEYVKELGYEGYITLGDYLVYRERVNTDKIARHILEEMLESSYHVDRLFDKDQLIDMWMEGQEKDEVIDDLVRSIELEEILDESIDDAYITSNGDVLKYTIADY